VPSFKATNSFGLRWWTPTVEVSLCGHATLATAHVLFSEVGVASDVLFFHTLSGQLTVRKSTLLSYGLTMDFPAGKPAPVHFPRETWKEILEAMTLVEEDIEYDKVEEQSVPVAVFCPVTKKLVIEVSSIDSLLRISPDLSRLLLIEFPSDIPVRGISVTTRGGKGKNEQQLHNFEEFDFVSRYFSPWNGVGEDPVNGASHTILPIHWEQRLGRTGRFRARMASARGGELYAEFHAETGRVTLEGQAVTVITGRLHIN